MIGSPRDAAHSAKTVLSWKQPGPRRVVAPFPAPDAATWSVFVSQCPRLRYPHHHRSSRPACPDAVGPPRAVLHPPRQVEPSPSAPEPHRGTSGVPRDLLPAASCAPSLPGNAVMAPTKDVQPDRPGRKLKSQGCQNPPGNSNPRRAHSSGRGLQRTKATASPPSPCVPWCRVPELN